MTRGVGDAAGKGIDSARKTDIWQKTAAGAKAAADATVQGAKVAGAATVTGANAAMDAVGMTSSTKVPADKVVTFTTERLGMTLSRDERTDRPIVTEVTATTATAADATATANANANANATPPISPLPRFAPPPQVVPGGAAFELGIHYGDIVVGVQKGFPKPPELQPPPDEQLEGSSQQSWAIDSYDQFMGLFPHVGRPVSLSLSPASKVKSADEGFEKSSGSGGMSISKGTGGVLNFKLEDELVKGVSIP